MEAPDGLPEPPGVHVAQAAGEHLFQVGRLLDLLHHHEGLEQVAEPALPLEEDAAQLVALAVDGERSESFG